MTEPHLKSIVTGIPLAEEQGIGALTLGGYVRELAERYGAAEAAVAWNGEFRTRWSYEDLLQQSEAVARSLVASGVSRGTRVGLLLTNRFEFLSGLFGCALIGAVATPLSTFSTARELDAMLKASAVTLLLMESRVLKKDFLEALIELEPLIAESEPGALLSLRYPYLRHLILVDRDAERGATTGWSNFLQRGESVRPEVIAAMADAVMVSDPAVLFFSSGSTGKPKGMLAAHRSVCLQLWRWKHWYAIQEPPRTIAANGFFFSGSFAMALGGTLSSGGTLILQPWFNAESTLSLAETECVSMILAWPHQWAQLEAAPNYDDVDLSAIRYMDRDSPIVRHPTVDTDWCEPDAYGSTESFTLITASPGDGVSRERGRSHGVPTAGSTIKIIDPLSGEVVPRGERGEIVIKGPTMMLGYLGIPLDETLDADGFFHTSDGGYIDDRGHLVWEGRLNDIIKTGGANVSPLEIDDVLRECPGVKISQTVGVPHELLGEMVVTCIVPHRDCVVTERDVIAFAKARLASYKAPRKVLFLEESQLKTTGSAKIKASELRELANRLISATNDEASPSISNPSIS